MSAKPDPLEAFYEKAELLSAAEIEEIKAEAAKQFAEGRKKSARAKLIKSELAALDKQYGLDTLDGGLNDPVTIVIDLPENSDRLLIDQQVYTNGQTITRPRHVINSILETMWRGQVAQHNLDGKTRDEFYRRQRPIAVTPGGAVFSQETVRLT